MVRTRTFLERHKKPLRVAVIAVWLACVLFTVTEPLCAQGDPTVDDVWTKVTNIIRGPIGKSIAAVGFIVGAVAMFLGNVPAGIMTLVGAAVIAFAPAIVNLLFD